jgi:hypothetical protein
MVTPSTPAWMRQQSDMFTSALEAKQQQAQNVLILRNRGQQYWHDLMAELQAVRNGLPKPLMGQFHHSNFDTSRSEDHCQLRITFLGDGTAYRSSCADLRYRPEENKLWYRDSLFQRDVRLTLCVVDGFVRSVSEQHGEPMDAEAAAELIAKPMVQYAASAALI